MIIGSSGIIVSYRIEMFISDDGYHHPSERSVGPISLSSFCDSRPASFRVLRRILRPLLYFLGSPSRSNSISSALHPHRERAG
jgi:hypothetical protein